MRSDATKIKLRAVIKAKQLTRGPIENAYIKLDDYKKLKKNFKKHEKNTDIIDIQISAIEHELEKIEDLISNAQVGTSVDAGGGFSSGGCAGAD